MLGRWKFFRSVNQMAIALSSPVAGLSGATLCEAC